MTLTPKTSFLLFALLVSAAAVVIGGCAKGDGGTAEFWRHMERQSY